MILQNIWKSVIGNILIIISPSNVFATIRFLAKFHDKFDEFVISIFVTFMALRKTKFQIHQNCRDSYGHCER